MQTGDQFTSLSIGLVYVTVYPQDEFRMQLTCLLDMWYHACGNVTLTSQLCSEPLVDCRSMMLVNNEIFTPESADQS